MFNLIERAWNFFHHRLIHAPRGGGKPVPAAAFDEEYRSGRWDHFIGPSEQARYEMLVKLIQSHHPSPSLLDVGCGSGRLAAMLDPGRISEYVGLDISVEGLKRARALNLPHAVFASGDFETWRPSKSYDAIIFNESIGYARHPASTAAAFSRYLKPAGVLIISYFRSGNYGPIWKSLDNRFIIIESRVVTNNQGQTWDLKVLRPKPCPRPFLRRPRNQT